MSFPLLLTCAAKSHALIERHIIADHRGLPDNDAMSMVNKKALSDLCARMDLNTRPARALLGNPSCPEIMVAQIQPVRQPVIAHHLKAWIEENFHIGVNRRITLAYDTDFLLYISDKAH